MTIWVDAVLRQLLKLALVRLRISVFVNPELQTLQLFALDDATLVFVKVECKLGKTIGKGFLSVLVKL